MLDQGWPGIPLPVMAKALWLVVRSGEAACNRPPDGGMRHVPAFLMQRTISGFDPKAPPPKTPAFWAIVDANRASEESEIADILDRLRNPPAVTLGRLVSVSEGDIVDWLRDRRNRRTIPH